MYAMHVVHAASSLICTNIHHVYLISYISARVFFEIGFGHNDYGITGTGKRSGAWTDPGDTALLAGPATSLTCGEDSCCAFIGSLKAQQCWGYGGNYNLVCTVCACTCIIRNETT